MATGIYLVDNPPRIRQYRSPRRERPSGLVVVHTAELFPDETGPDTGAENVARFIRDRTNYGSYHDLCDSDSIIRMVRYTDEAFQDGTGSNPHAYSVSAATQASKWRTVSDDWREAAVSNMARATANYAKWLKREEGIVIPSRRITRAESEDRKPGFISHAERDPDRRTDPGKSFPWGNFLGLYELFMSGAIVEDDMPLTNDDVEKIWNYVIDKVDPTSGTSPRMRAQSFLSYIHDYVVNLPANAAKAAWERRHQKVDPTSGSSPDMQLESFIAYIHHYTLTAIQEAKANNAKLDVLLEAIKGVNGIDGDALATKVAEAVERLDAEAVADELVITVREDQDSASA